MHYFEPSTVNHYWKRSSTLDWCEQNYHTSQFIAEFYNSLTNICYILLAIYGMYNVRKHHFESRFFIAYMSILIIGLGSFCFHTTLVWEMQLADELPMIYATCVFLYILFESSKHNQYGYVLPVLLFLDALLITVYYVHSKNPVFHQVMNGINTVAIALRGMYLFYFKLPYLTSGVREKMAYLVRMGCFLYLMGFVAWNMDNVFCEQLRWLREETVPSVVSPLLQFHGWWHLGTASGSYYFTVFCQMLRVNMIQQEEEYELIWKWKVLPVLVMTGKSSKWA